MKSKDILLWTLLLVVASGLAACSQAPTPEAVRLHGRQTQYTKGGSSIIKNTKRGETTLTCESNL